MYTIREIIQGGPGVSAREIGNQVRVEMREVGAKWHRDMLPRHFAYGADKRYNYQPRHVGTIRQKLRRRGHNLPLVDSGDMATQLRMGATITATTGGKRPGVRVVMKGPKYLYMYRKDYRQPDKAAEVRAVTADEVQELSRLLEERVWRVQQALMQRDDASVAPVAPGEGVSIEL